MSPVNTSHCQHSIQHMTALRVRASVTCQHITRSALNTTYDSLESTGQCHLSTHHTVSTRGRNSGCPAVRGLPEIRSDCRRWRQRQSDGHPPNSGIFLHFSIHNVDLRQRQRPLLAYMLSLPHSAGDCRKYR